MTKRKRTVRELFEAWSIRRNDDPDFRADVWLKRSDIWGEPGYDQPSTHYAWLAFLAGYRAGRRKRT